MNMFRFFQVYWFMYIGITILYQNLVPPFEIIIEVLYHICYYASYGVLALMTFYYLDSTESSLREDYLSARWTFPLLSMLGTSIGLLYLTYSPENGAMIYESIIVMYMMLYSILTLKSL